MRGVADQQDAAPVPRRWHEERLDGAVDDGGIIVDEGVADFGDRPAVFGETLAEGRGEAFGRELGRPPGRRLLDEEDVHDVVGERDEAGFAVGADEHLQALDVGSPRHVVAPAHLPDVLGAQLGAEDEAAHERVDAVGADDDVVGAGGSVGELDVDTVVRLQQARHRDAGADVRTRLERGLLEDPVQRRAGDAVHGRSGCAGREREVRRRAERVAVAVVELVAGHREALLHAGRGQAELAERAQRVAGLDDPDAVDVPLRVDLDDVHGDAAPAERDARAQAADAAADDEDLLDRRHRHSANWPIWVKCSRATSSGGKDSIIESGMWTLRK